MHIPIPSSSSLKELKMIYNNLLECRARVGNLEEAYRYQDRLEIVKTAYSILPFLPSHPRTGLPCYTREGEMVIDALIKYGAYNMVVLLDVRSVKKVNEIKGYKDHSIGDYYLWLVGETLRKNFREEDIIMSMYSPPWVDNTFYPSCEPIISMCGSDEMMVLLYLDPSKVTNPHHLLVERMEKINKEIYKGMKEYFKENNINYDDSFPLGVKYTIKEINEEMKKEGIRKLREEFTL